MYESALNPAEWTETLNRILAALHGVTGVLHVADLQTGSDEIIANVGWTDQDRADYGAHYFKCDLWVSEGIKHPLNHAYRFSDLVAQDAFERSEFWNDFCRRVGPGIFYGIGAGVELGSSKVGLIGLQRPREARDFGEKQKNDLGLLLPHLQRALMVRDRLVTLERAADLAYGALDRLRIGVVITRADGSIIFANTAAHALSRATDGFHIGARGRLAAGLPAETAHLTALIAQAATKTMGSDESAGGVLRLSRPSMRRPYLVIVSPLPCRLSINLAALVLITDPEQRDRAESDQIARLHGLTPAETRLAVALVLGKTVNAYANETSLSLNTVRWTMKQLLAKTGTHRQTDLIQLLTSITAHLSEEM